MTTCSKSKFLRFRVKLNFVVKLLVSRPHEQNAKHRNFEERTAYSVGCFRVILEDNYLLISSRIEVNKLGIYFFTGKTGNIINLVSLGNIIC